MKIIVDAFGGDNAPLEIIKGCEQAVAEYGIEILLVGKEQIIGQVAEENHLSLKNITIADAPDIITMEDSPKSIARQKKNSSMAEGLRLLSMGKGDAFISAGNSGALVLGSNLFVKRIKGVRRMAFAPVLPKSEGFFMLIDGGANVDCRPEMLVQFGMMGSAYMEKVMGVKNPRVALANVGTEDHKGGTLQQETFALLKQSPINFIGNVEARTIPFDAADVIVCDGFTGNIILKMYEGVALAMMQKLKGVFTKSMKNKIATSLIYNDIKQMKKEMDYNEYGGAPIMGVSKPVFKAHGSAKAKTFKNALRLTKAYVEGNVTSEVEKALKNFHPGQENLELKN